MDEKHDHRKEIEAADATGLVAGEELITQAETMLHAALPEGHAAHETIDALHAEVSKPAPNRKAVEEHVNRLRLLPELEAIVVNWWDDPKVQRFFGDLGQIGV